MGAARQISCIDIPLPGSQCIAPHSEIWASHVTASQSMQCGKGKKE